MKTRMAIVSFVVIALVALSASPVQADGIIIPEPTVCSPGMACPISQLVIRYHHVEVKIDNQIAVTHVDQVFYNPNDYAVEGIYVFPLPAQAAVSDFVLWVDGDPVSGEVMDANQARDRYEELVRELKDPALLEYVGKGAIQASVFPIPPQSERHIELTYNQVLTIDNGLVRYDYPLNTEKFSREPLDSVSVSVNIITTEPARAVYSPTHVISISKEDEHHIRASYEASDVLPDKDFTIYYSVGKQEAFHLFTYRDQSDLTDDDDGSFLLLLAPKPGVVSAPIDKDIILVLDHSGSMKGEKFQQAQAATKYILSHLNQNDSFFLLTFNDGISEYSERLQPAIKSQDAINWMENMEASGSTDINRALLEAAAIIDEEKPTYLIFLTDGLPTVGVKNADGIQNNFSKSAPANVRLFVFGVGYDVDTYLLDTISQQHHGLSSYVKPEDSLDEVLSGFYQRISTPVLTDLELDFGIIETYDIYPNPIPDLFVGSQVVIVGRYKKGGSTDIVVRGNVNGEKVKFIYEGQIFSNESQASHEMDEIPRLWATRKIGNLLNRIRLNGPDEETVSQIVLLSIRYGIVTPYTSYLVTEPKALGANNQEQLVQQTYQDLQSMPTAPTSGREAVEKAAAEGQMSQAEVVESPAQSIEEMVKVVGSRTFVKDGEQWIDTIYDPDSMDLTKVAFLSDDYFSLARLSDQTAGAMALGEQVIFVLNGEAYEVVKEGSTVQPLILDKLNPSQATTGLDEMTPVDQPSAEPVTPQVSMITPTSITSEKEASITLIGVGGGLFGLLILIILLMVRRINRASRS